MQMKIHAGLGAIALLAGLLPLSLSSPSPRLEGRSHFAERDGQKIHVWEKVSAESSADRPVVVFLHGATWSGSPDFALL